MFKDTEIVKVRVKANLEQNKFNELKWYRAGEEYIVTHARGQYAKKFFVVIRGTHIYKLILKEDVEIVESLKDYYKNIRFIKA